MPEPGSSASAGVEPAAELRGIDLRPRDSPPLDDQVIVCPSGDRPRPSDPAAVSTTPVANSPTLGVGLLERGLREVRVGPNEDVGGTFVTVMDERIELASDPEQRSRLKSLRDAVLGVGQEVLGGVLTEAVKRAAIGRRSVRHARMRRATASRTSCRGCGTRIGDY